jgi:hypothetical protein
MSHWRIRGSYFCLVVSAHSFEMCTGRPGKLLLVRPDGRGRDEDFSSPRTTRSRNDSPSAYIPLTVAVPVGIAAMDNVRFGDRDGYIAVLSTIMAIVARAALTTRICASIASRCEAATEFAGLVAAGDVPKAVALMSPASPTIANEIAHHGYATGFVAALLAAAAVAGLSAIVVAIQMRPARGRSSSQNAFAVEDEGRSGSKPIVSAGPIRAAPLVFDAAQTPNAAAGGTESEESCSA